MSEQTISANKSTGVSKQPIDVIVGIIFAGVFMSLIILVMLTPLYR
ncbi:MAG: formate/nitrite transporter FocA (FNT family) [Oleiphilaceae bacterium]|jgi:formate/nitrite transporter FocA (FNT family)